MSPNLFYVNFKRPQKSYGYDLMSEGGGGVGINPCLPDRKDKKCRKKGRKPVRYITTDAHTHIQSLLRWVGELHSKYTEIVT